MIVISHAMDHVIEVADRAVVMRRGRKVGEEIPTATASSGSSSLIVGGDSSIARATDACPRTARHGHVRPASRRDHRARGPDETAHAAGGCVAAWRPSPRARQRRCDRRSSRATAAGAAAGDTAPPRAGGHQRAPSGRADQDRLHHQVPGRLLRHHGRRREGVEQGPPRGRARLRPGQERHRRRGRDRRDRVDDHPGRQGHRHHADEPERPGRAAEGGRRRASRWSWSTTTSRAGTARPRSSRPTTSPAASSPASSSQAPRRPARHRRPCSRACPAPRRSTTASTALEQASGRLRGRRRSSPTDCDQTKGLDAAQDILTAQPGRHGDLLAPAARRSSAPSKAIKNAGKAGQITSSASTPGPTRSQRSSPATSSARSPSSRPRWASSASQARLDAVSGKTVEANIDTGTEMVTKDNAADFGG